METLSQHLAPQEAKVGLILQYAPQLLLEQLQNGKSEEITASDHNNIEINITTTESTPKWILSKAGQTKLFDKLQADNWFKGAEREEIMSKTQLKHIIRTMYEKIVRSWENFSSILKHK